MIDFTETPEEFVERVKRGQIAAKLRPRVKKERPIRVLETEAGQVLLVEWRCPACLSKGCKACKFSGVMDGITKAVYNDSQLRPRITQGRPSRLGR